MAVLMTRHPERGALVADLLAPAFASVAGVSEEIIGAAKILGHWLTFGPLLLLAAVPGSFLLGLEGQALVAPMIALAIGTPALAALSVAVAALTAGVDVAHVEPLRHHGRPHIDQIVGGAHRVRAGVPADAGHGGVACGRVDGGVAPCARARLRARGIGPSSLPCR